jgi:hypothetical protein
VNGIAEPYTVDMTMRARSVMLVVLVTWVLRVFSDTRGLTIFLFCTLLQKNAGMVLKLHSVGRNCRLLSLRASAIADRSQHIHF